jgi:hypothetical protein
MRRSTGMLLISRDQTAASSFVEFIITGLKSHGRNILVNLHATE